MAFGFSSRSNSDSSEVNGYDGVCHEYDAVPAGASDYSPSNSSGDSDLRLLLRTRVVPDTYRVDCPDIDDPFIYSDHSYHPVYKPSETRCAYCSDYGHSVLNCRERLENAEKLTKHFCVRGWHLPHLHDGLDIWRCRWCSMHLKDDYVWHNYPTVAAKEYEKSCRHRNSMRRYQ